ncbi:MAG: GAF domain-containing sensor histidine kinase [Candidatus Pseudobacter hemicellulosilyticus]|uniref:histidine kinase n=1 Tax=Candidatus Pseudobacter hemicellulosilyticus TaxID=3121375 RepID=A0AAJ6BE24_9BACT|nr:MAG: GAF domain-containing sensor histidine kinase [Pseudobacter sp.]
MISAVLPQKEAERLAELYSLNLLDTESEQDFTDVVELASFICQTPISLISLIDKDRQWFKAAKGLNATETPRSIALCAHTILSSKPLIVTDVTSDKRFLDNPLVQEEPSIRFYAGFPLISKAGNNLGSLCVIDNKPRQLDDHQLNALAVLSKQVIKLMEERRTSELLREISQLELKQSAGLKQLIDTQRRIMSILGHDTRAPLHAINRLIKQVSLGTVSATEITPYFELIGNQLDATIILLDNLVAWGKTHVAPGTHSADRFMVQRVVDESIELLSEAAINKNITLINKVKETIFMFTSRQIVGFTLRNLISNAIKFSDHGTVTITAVPRDAYIAITVTDTGIGMTASQVKAYKNNQAVSSSGTSHESGSGLGVVLIHEFLQQHGGRMEVDSVLGEGTSITVYFQAQKP